MGNNPGTILATGFIEAGNIDVDAAGNVLVSDRSRMGVYRVPPTHNGAAITEAMRVAGVGNSLTTNSGAGANGLSATTVGMMGVRGVACHPLGGFFTATHRGGDVWYVDSAGRAWMFVQGDNGNTHEAADTAVPTTGFVMSEPRSVSVGLSGNVLIACNDAGFIRIVRSIAPLSAAPQWLPGSVLPGGQMLRWQSTAGKWYFLERNPALSADGWQPLTWFPATGPATSWNDATAGARGFYRLREFRAWPN
jgi:hypothetical protein